MVGPTTSLSSLNRADGSASYKCPATGYDVLAAVNAPIELPARRDALKPEEATIEVFVKPGTSGAGVGERHAEGILRSVLSEVILGRERGFPRRGVVITLAIVGGKSAERGDSVSDHFVESSSRSVLIICSISPSCPLFCTPHYLPFCRPPSPCP